MFLAVSILLFALPEGVFSAGKVCLKSSRVGGSTDTVSVVVGTLVLNDGESTRVLFATDHVGLNTLEVRGARGRSCWVGRVVSARGSRGGIIIVGGGTGVVVVWSNDGSVCDRWSGGVGVDGDGVGVGVDDGERDGVGDGRFGGFGCDDSSVDGDGGGFAFATASDKDSGSIDRDVGREVLSAVFGGDGIVSVDESKLGVDLCMTGFTVETVFVPTCLKMKMGDDVAESVAMGNLSGDLESAANGVSRDITLFGDVINQALGFGVEETIFIDTKYDKFLLEVCDTCTVFVVLLRSTRVEHSCGVGVDVGGVAGADLGDVDVGGATIVTKVASGDLDTVGVKANIRARTSWDVGVRGAEGARVLVGDPLIFCKFSFATRARDFSAITGFLRVVGEVELVEALSDFLLDVSVTSTDVVAGDVGAVGRVEVEVRTVLETLGATATRTRDTVRRAEAFGETVNLAETAESELESPGLFGHLDSGVAEEQCSTFLCVVLEVALELVTFVLDERDVLVVDVDCTSALTLSAITFFADAARGGTVNT